MFRIADTEKLPRCPGITDEYAAEARAKGISAGRIGKAEADMNCSPSCRPQPTLPGCV